MRSASKEYDCTDASDSVNILNSVNESREEIGLKVVFDTLSNVTGASESMTTCVGYWSDALGRYIMIDSDIKLEHETIDDMMDDIVGFDQIARETESLLVRHLPPRESR